MKRKRLYRSALGTGWSRQTGFAAIAAIFLVVMLAGLGAFMVTFSNTQQLTSAQDLQGSRAYWAARAGLEWGVGSVVDCANTPATCPRTTTTAPPLGCPTTPSTTTLSPIFDGGFEVKVTLACYAYFEEAPEPTSTANRFIYQFSSVAKSGTVGAIGHVERSVSASLECKRNGPKDGLAYVNPSDPLTYTCG